MGWLKPRVEPEWHFCAYCEIWSAQKQAITEHERKCMNRPRDEDGSR